MTFELHKGANIEALRKMAAGSIDSVVTDGPYGLSREPDMAEVLRHWLDGDDYDHKASGFMGKSWDSFVPGPAVWREVLRVLKPGGHVFAFSGTRTYDMAVLAMRLAGFEIRDQFIWGYGSGMPKSRNLGDGWGTAAKPAWEPIVLARKPFKGTTEACRREHGTGGLNIDACRIQTDGEVLRAGAGTTWDTMHRHEGRGRDGEASAERRYTVAGGTNFAMKPGPRGGDPAGRWPANLLHDGSDEVLACFPSEAGGKAPLTGDEPSAASVGVVTNARARVASNFIGDTGGAARFFYCAKASTAEREAGLAGLQDGILARSCQAQTLGGSGQVKGKGAGAFNVARVRKNTHPTVKPVEVGRWLQRMITPPGGTTLDIYVGSGSFGVSAILEGFNFIGIDIDDDGTGNPLGYLDIARARCEWAEAEVVKERQRREQEQREQAARAAQVRLFEVAA